MKVLMVLTSHDKLGDTGRKTGLGGDCCDGHSDDWSGDSIVESAFHVERLPHPIGNAAIRHDRRAQSCIGGG